MPGKSEPSYRSQVHIVHTVHFATNQLWYNTPVEYWELSDELLLQQCDWYAGRASGPGGQKRNKTHSAINMIHTPTNAEITITGTSYASLC